MNHCPVCTRPMPSPGPLPPGSVRLCPCRLREGRHVTRLAFAVAELLRRHGPLNFPTLLFWTAADTPALTAALAVGGWFEPAGGRWAATEYAPGPLGVVPLSLPLIH